MVKRSGNALKGKLIRCGALIEKIGQTNDANHSLAQPASEFLVQF